MQVPWGIKAFSGYLGEDRAAWAQYDATELVRELPLTLGLVLDTSGSMSESMVEAKRAAQRFLEAVLRLARLEVVRAEFADLAGEIVRHEIESHVALGGGVASGR